MPIKNENHDVSHPICLTIAGIDSSGGAGVLIDAAMIRRAGAHPAAVITATTAQNSSGVHDVHPIPVEHIEKQLHAVLEDMTVSAAKTGMLPDPETIRTVGRVLSEHRIPLVVDPVMVATAGSSLTLEDTVDAFHEYLFPRASLITPNLPEALRLLKRSTDSPEDIDELARSLSEEAGTAVLLKGGHGRDEIIRDVLVHGKMISTFTSRRRSGTFHGTGCALSASIAGFLARGSELHRAVASARALLTGAIDGAFAPGETDMRYLKV